MHSDNAQPAGAHAPITRTVRLLAVLWRLFDATNDNTYLEMMSRIIRYAYTPAPAVGQRHSDLGCAVALLYDLFGLNNDDRCLDMMMEIIDDAGPDNNDPAV